MVTLIESPFKGNQLKAETGQIVHFWLLVVDESVHYRPTTVGFVVEG